MRPSTGKHEHRNVKQEHMHAPQALGHPAGHWRHSNSHPACDKPAAHLHARGNKAGRIPPQSKRADDGQIKQHGTISTATATRSAGFQHKAKEQQATKSYSTSPSPRQWQQGLSDFTTAKEQPSKTTPLHLHGRGHEAPAGSQKAAGH